MIPDMGDVRERETGRDPRAAALHELAEQMREAVRSGRDVAVGDDDPSLREVIEAANALGAAARRSRERATGALREHEAMDRSLSDMELRLAEEIREHEKTARDLSRQRTALHHVVESLPYCIFWRDRNGVYLGANQNKLRALGLDSLDQLVGKTAYETGVSREEADYYRQIDEQVMATGQPIFNLEEVQQRPDGPHRLLISKVPLRDDTGAVIGIIGMYVDITRRVRIAPRVVDGLPMQRIG
jgi:PAS domain S-box-containing protein